MDIIGQDVVLSQACAQHMSCSVCLHVHIHIHRFSYDVPTYVHT